MQVQQPKEKSANFSDLFLTPSTHTDVSELAGDESVIRKSMGVHARPDLDFIEEFEEEVVEDGNEEEVVEEEVVYRDSGTSFIEVEMVSSDEEEIEVEEASASAVDFTEVEILDEDVPISPSGAQRPSLPKLEDSPHRESDALPARGKAEIPLVPQNPEEKLEATIEDVMQGEPETDESEEESYVDFASCLDVTDEIEEELTRRLHGAMHLALDAWDLHHLELEKPRPQTPSPRAAAALLSSANSAFSPVENNNNNNTPTTSKAKKKLAQAASRGEKSDLHWAARKAADIIYPDNYCVPPISSLEDARKELEDSSNAKRRQTTTTNVKETQKVDDEIVLVEIDVNAQGNVPKKLVDDGQKEEQPGLVDTDGSTSGSTSASTNSGNNASSSSSSAALSSRPLFWAVEGALETIYPFFSGKKPPIAFVEEDDMDDSQILREHQKEFPNTQIFALRLRQYQVEKKQDPQQQRTSLRVPEGDDLNAPIRTQSRQSKDEQSQSANASHNSSNYPASAGPLQQGGPDVEGAGRKSSLPVPEGDELNAPQPAKQNAGEPEAEDADSSSSSSFQSQLQEDKFQNEPVTPEIPSSIDPDETRNVKGTKRSIRFAMPPEVEPWDDEEAQHIPTAPREVYNTDPSKYDPDNVVFERELIIVPKKEPRIPVPGEERVAICRGLLCVLMLIVPTGVGLYLFLQIEGVV